MKIITIIIAIILINVKLIGQVYKFDLSEDTFNIYKFYYRLNNTSNQQDSTIHKTNFLKTSDPKVWLISGAIVAIPSMGMLALSDDKTSKYIYGTLSITGNLALIVGATKTFKEDHKLRNKFAHYSCMSLGGVSDALIEELMHHYDAMKIKFPNMDDKYCNPLLSCNNKYQNGDPNQGEAFPLSTSLFVAGTDLYHGLRAFNKTMWLGGIITFQKGKNAFYTIVEGIISIIVYTTAKGSLQYILQH